MLFFQRQPEAPDITDGQPDHEVHQNDGHQDQEQGKEELRQPKIVWVPHYHVHEVKLPQEHR